MKKGLATWDCEWTVIADGGDPTDSFIITGETYYPGTVRDEEEMLAVSITGRNVGKRCADRNCHCDGAQMARAEPCADLTRNRRPRPNAP